MDRAGVLVDGRWLEARLADPAVRVLDVRGAVRTSLTGIRETVVYEADRTAYAAAHVPGALFVDWTRDIVDLEDPVPVQVATPDRFAAWAGAAGIGPGTTVVVYDGPGGMLATRLWWALTYHGHVDVRVLDGGLDAWVRDERPMTAAVPRVAPAVFAGTVRPELRLDAAALLERVRSRRGVVIDARSLAQYRGDVVRGRRGGHVPGACNLPAADLLDPATGRWRTPDDLADVLRGAGLDPETGGPVATYCGGGVAATAVAFALTLLGHGDAAVYDGSWNEWGERTDLPNQVSTPT
jgi:thiosulfate/3-mercaptopyruvate sulfurtransferase